MACTLVNCTNSYEKKDIMPELVQLAKFSKQHVPEQHPKVKRNVFFYYYTILAFSSQSTPKSLKPAAHCAHRAQAYILLGIFYFQDKKDFVDKRVKRLLKAGVTSALAVMVKAENSILTDQTKEMLARWVSNETGCTICTNNQ